MWNLNWNLSWPTTYRTSGIDIRNSNKVDESPSLSKQRETAVNLLRDFRKGNYLDLKCLMPRRLVSSSLFLTFGVPNMVSHMQILTFTTIQLPPSSSQLAWMQNRTKLR